MRVHTKLALFFLWGEGAGSISSVSVWCGGGKWWEDWLELTDKLCGLCIQVARFMVLHYEMRYGL